MNFSKLIISFFLLFIYSFGFAHNLVPHGSEISNENHTSIHIHHQHINDEEQNHEHNHITHNNHFDRDVYDFIVCLTNEPEDTGEECYEEHCFTINSNDLSLKDTSKIQSVITLFAIFSIENQNVLFANYFKKKEVNYLSPLVENSPLRGPPFIS